MRRMLLDFLIPAEWKQLWDVWDLRGLMILSFSLQAFLILLAPLRKQTSRKWITTPLWLAYLLADWVTNFVAVFISYNQGNPDCNSIKTEKMQNQEILAFWASFIFMRLGGPDTITAFLLEDNELWLRHFLGLVFQCLVAVYVFVQSLPHNQLWIPTMLMLMTGIIKYAERTRALYLASVNVFKVSTGDYLSKKSIIKTTNKAKEGSLTELEVVQYGHWFVQTFKGLVVDVIFRHGEWNQSRDFLLKRTAKDAFKVIQVELNFIYDDLFTKLPVVHSYFGAMSWFFSFGTDCLATVLFILKMDKSKFDHIDVTITYGLVFGALTLDIIALFMLIFSDQTIISLWKLPKNELDNKSTRTRTVGAFLKLMTKSVFRGWPIWIPKKRWSESISTYNLIYQCLHPCSDMEKLVYENLGLSGFLDDIRYIKTEKFTIELRDFIFDELKSKLELANDLGTTKDKSSTRRDWLLRAKKDWSSLLPYALDIDDYDQRLLVLHIATELCYNKELNDELNCKAPVNSNSCHREIAKLLSGYMLYLLMMQPSMMSSIAGNVQTNFRDICIEAKNILKSGKDLKMKQVKRNKEVDWEQINACIEILAEQKDVAPVIVKGMGNKSLLFESRTLAKELMKIEEKDKSTNKWLIISKVWVDLLCYAASHSQASSHATQLSKGGDLITLVWLLMAHFGFSDQFQIKKEN